MGKKQPEPLKQWLKLDGLWLRTTEAKARHLVVAGAPNGWPLFRARCGAFKVCQDGTPIRRWHKRTSSGVDERLHEDSKAPRCTMCWHLAAVDKAKLVANSGAD